ncbi:hypothetical protein [Streptomyces mirabilis]|uniref:hypothetical protein n=1 Tax=Streptomyces mirabilis TaxID=68239 RepID=UPI00367AF261
MLGWRASEAAEALWDRPFFLDVDRHIWRVTGAHDFTPLATTHQVNRFERWTYDGDAAQAARLLEQAWPALRDDAEAAGAASVWLLHQPDEKQIGVLTVAARTGAEIPEEAASRSLDALARTRSPGRLLPDALDAVQVFVSRDDLEGDEFTDRYTEAVEKLIEAKREHKEPPKASEEQAAPGGVVDLMAALQESVRKAQASRGEDATVHAIPKKTTKRAPTKNAATKKATKKPAAKQPRSA